MSHQDPVRKAASETHAADLYKVFQWLTPARCFASIEFRRHCGWTPRTLVFAALLWSWSDYSKLGRRFQHALKIIQGLFKKQHVPAVSYQAFMKLLQRWTDRLLECLLGAYRDKMCTALGDAWQLGQWLVFAVDGSRVKVPRTRRNEERYSPKSKLSRRAQQRRRQRRRKRLAKRAREEQANVPQIWITVLWHAASGLPWAWQTGPSDSSERDHLRNMLSTMPAGALLAADAGFVGYDLWNAIRERPLHWLIRVGRHVRLLKNLGYGKHDRGCVYLWPDQAARKNLPPLVLRLIVLSTGRHPVYLLTNLTARQLPDREAEEIYRRRWGLEVFYRHAKQTFERAKLRSKNPDNALVELQWSLMSMWAMGLYSHVHLARQGVPLRKISFVGVLDAFRQAMREHGLCPTTGERLREWIDAAVIDDYVRVNKANRDYPQQKQHQPPGSPIIQAANASQKRKAQQHQDIQPQRLTA
jgi:Transposase DDE domain